MANFFVFGNANMADEKRAQLTGHERGLIEGWFEQRASVTEIAKRTDRAKSMISILLKKVKEKGSSERKKGSGRKRKTTEREDRVIAVKARRVGPEGRRKSAAKIARELKEELGVNIGKDTVMHRVHEVGMTSCVACKKPSVSEKNCQKRLIWERTHVGWSEAKWRKVLWSDESPFVIRWGRGIGSWCGGPARRRSIRIALHLL